MKRYDYDEQIKRMYLEEELSCKKIGEILNINSVTVFNTLKRLNVSTRKHNGSQLLFEERIDVNELINDYVENKLSLKALGEKYQVAPNTIKKVLIKYRIERRPTATTITYNPYIVEDYFEKIDSIGKAYFLGFMIADGNVGKDNSIRIELQAKDKYILELFSDELGLNNKLKYSNRNDKETYTLTFKSLKTKKDLSQLTVTPNKTFTVQLPLISIELMPHLIRGIIDGDGWITTYFNQRGKEVGSIGLCGNQFIVQGVADYLHQTLNVYPVKPSKRGNIYQVVWSRKKDILKIGEFIYQDAKDYKLIRKYEKFQHILSIHGNTELT